MAGGAEQQQESNLSLRLHEVMEQVGASEEMRRIYRRRAKIQEVLQTLIYTLNYRKIINVHICGSNYEGTVTPDLASDVDSIQCLDDPPVVQNPCESPHKSLVMVTDEWTYPGYVKLQWVLHGLPLTADLVSVSRDQDYDIDAAGRLCQKHFNKENSQGPAEAVVNENGVHYVDNVFALRCSTLPEFARRRLAQLGSRGILSPVEVQRLSDMGCMFVRVGHFKSCESSIEWRLSMSMQERYLMSKLNPTQHKVYILLKMIKKNIVEKTCKEKTLTSYHCKTCVLYAVEMTRGRNWIPCKLLKRLRQCIKLLIIWLRSNHCPNYFFKDQNLYSKREFQCYRKVILHVLEPLQTNYKFLSLLVTDNVGAMLLDDDERWRNTSHEKNNKRVFELNLHTLRSVYMSVSRTLMPLCEGRYDAASFLTVLHRLQQTDTVTGHTAAETREALGYVLPWFHLHAAKTLACLACRSDDQMYKDKMMASAYLHFRKADRTDHVNVQLAIASVFYSSEEYENCFSLLQRVEHEYTYTVLTQCPCVGLKVIDFKGPRDERSRYEAVRDMSIRTIMKRFTACCVRFLPSELQITPVPLHYEMLRSQESQPGSRNEHEEFWFDWAVVDAKVYLHFMQYLVSAKLQKEAHKQVARDNLQALIEEENRVVKERGNNYRKLGHRETAYNLLGWIHMQEKRYGDALQCFMCSWDIRKHHNAARLHVKDLSAILAEGRGPRLGQP